MSGIAINVATCAEGVQRDRGRSAGREERIRRRTMTCIARTPKRSRRSLVQRADFEKRISHSPALSENSSQQWLWEGHGFSHAVQTSKNAGLTRGELLAGRPAVSAAFR
jgi:hypothetical protein